MQYERIAVPTDGAAIPVNRDGSTEVPDHPIPPGTEAADLVMTGVVNTIASRELTFDLARVRKAIRAPRHGHARSVEDVRQELEELVPGATLVGTSGFGEAVVRHMDD